MRRYDAVLWDLDGTLLDTLEDLTDSVNFTLRHYGMPERTIDEVKSFVGNGARVLIALSVAEGCSEEKIDEICGFFRAHYAKNCDIKTGPYKGLLELMEKLRAKGVKMAIVSNKPDYATKELSEIYFKGLVASAVGEDEAHGIRKKPCPDAVLAAMGELATGRESTVYIGDSEVDIATAKNAGIPCISVTWGFRSREALIENGAERLIDTPEELEKYLLCGE